jgi:FAD:protein FMN transferase
MKKILFLILISFFIISCNKEQLIVNDGFIHGTTYHIIYKSNNGIDLQEEIEKQMRNVDTAWSTYLPVSSVSRINNNDSSVLLNNYFNKVFIEAQEISTITNGAFDLTVAPLVNAWGFGFKNADKIDSTKIDSILSFVGFNKVKLHDNVLQKTDPRIMLDASAIAKGFSVDVVSEYLESKGIENYLVEIGGEIRTKGKKSTESNWKVGIDKPIDDVKAFQREFQDIVLIENLAMATSGNYRQFYIKEGKKYAHTINPKTGFPIIHNLLSATVIAANCITADAYATAFMVLGLEESKKILEQNPSINAYFIYSDENNDYKVFATEKFKSILVEKQ